MFTSVDKSLMKQINSRGPNTVPCDTQEMTSHCSLNMPFKTTEKRPQPISKIFYPVNKLWAYSVVFKFLNKSCMGDFGFTIVKE